MIIVGMLGWVIAITNTGNLITILMFSFTLRAAGAFFPYVFGLYWKKSSLQGTIASLIAGSIIVVLVERKVINFFDLDPIIPGLIAGFMFLIGFTWLMPRDRANCDLIPEDE